MSRAKKVSNHLGQWECSKCGKFKDPDEFYAHDFSANGLQSRCKECMREDARKYSHASFARARVIMDALAYKDLRIQLAYYQAGRTPPDIDTYDVSLSARDQLDTLGFDVTQMNMRQARDVAEEIRKEADEFTLEGYDPTLSPTEAREREARRRKAELEAIAERNRELGLSE